MNRSSRAGQWIPVFAFGFSGACMALLMAVICSAAVAQTSAATEQRSIDERPDAGIAALR